MTEAAHADHSSLMSLPLPNGKLAMWFFLITEIMFFTALIGTYLIIRNAIPNDPDKLITWPTPKQAHLEEWVGAFNTFVLILSSLTVVLAHHAAGKGNFKHAGWYIAATTVLGLVFLAVKAYEYNAKFAHDILPGRMGELLPGMSEMRQRQMHAIGMQYVERVRGQLRETVEKATGKAMADVQPADVAEAKGHVKDSYALFKRM